MVQWTLRILLLTFLLSGGAGQLFGQEQNMPAPNPPVVENIAPAAPLAEQWYAPMGPAAAVEWTYHKTGDNAHPDGNEQQMMWLINRARSNPTQEGIWLATMTDPDVDSARTF